LARMAQLNLLRMPTPVDIIPIMKTYPIVSPPFAISR
jgi:hypothetical protein